MQLVTRAAVFFLWCFVFSLPWDVVIDLPALGSIPRIVGLVASAVGIVYIVARRRFRELTWFHVFAVLFVLWSGVTSFWSIDPAATWTRFITYIQLVVMVWLIWEVAWTSERRRGLLQAYVLGAGAAALATIQNYLSGVAHAGKVTAEGQGYRFAGLNQDPNELGVILGIALPMAWYLGLGQPQRRLSWIWRLYIPVGLTAILLTASRAALVTALVALSLVPWTLGRLRLRTKVIVSVLAVASVALAITFVPAASLERLQTLRADIEAGYFGGRIYIWQAGWEVAKQHALLGVGAGNFGLAIAPTLHREMASHQAFLEILVEQGVVGLILFLAMVTAVVKPLRHLPDIHRRLSLVLLATLAVGSLTLHLGYRKPVWFVLGLVAAQIGERRPRRTSPSDRYEADAGEPGSWSPVLDRRETTAAVVSASARQSRGSGAASRVPHSLRDDTTRWPPPERGPSSVTR